MDIKQALNAVALITLGKDMSFRDYAQGAFRMRGIGAGQVRFLSFSFFLSIVCAKKRKEQAKHSEAYYFFFRLPL